ncbi:hypothetical protein GUY61_35340, partial [Streptomyces sp. GC420]|nr:hypothetical protein [Streptomyces sp. GC420]
SWHRPVFPSGPPMVPGLRVESVTVVRGRLELRAHRVVGAPPGARVEQTGWATGPGEPPLSALHGLHGWTGRDEVRAPEGTAFARWVRVPRLSADAEGTAVYAALATLTAEPGPAPLADAVGEVTVDADSGVLRVRWADDGALTRIGFGPLTVEHMPAGAGG